MEGWMDGDLFPPKSKAWMKLQSLKAGAQLATRSFLEQQAPVLCRSIALTSTPFRPVIFSSQD